MGGRLPIRVPLAGAGVKELLKLKVVGGALFGTGPKLTYRFVCFIVVPSLS